MNLIKVIGPQGSGKSTMVDLFVTQRSEKLGARGILYHHGGELPRLSGKIFHTVVLDGVHNWEYGVDVLGPRLGPNGIIIVVSNEDI